MLQNSKTKRRINLELLLYQLAICIQEKIDPQTLCSTITKPSLVFEQFYPSPNTS